MKAKKIFKKAGHEKDQKEIGGPTSEAYSNVLLTQAGEHGHYGHLSHCNTVILIWGLHRIHLFSVSLSCISFPLNQVVAKGKQSFRIFFLCFSAFCHPLCSLCPSLRAFQALLAGFPYQSKRYTVAGGQTVTWQAEVLARPDRSRMTEHTLTLANEMSECVCVCGGVRE